MTSRRGFLGALLGAAVLDREKLLWVPGAKLISIPRPRPSLARRAKIGDTLMVRRPLRFVPLKPSEPWPVPLLVAGALEAFTVIGFRLDGEPITEPAYVPSRAGFDWLVGPPR